MRLSNRHTHFLGLLTVLTLTACAPPKMTTEITSKQPNTPVATKVSAKTVTSWDISGAMAARNQSKSWSASLQWAQMGPNDYQIRLSGPLGGGTVLIVKQKGLVTYTDGPKKMSSSNADTLLKEQTGIQLPVNHLYYWVRGLPAPGAVQGAHYSPTGELISLQQSGYSIQYANYTSVNALTLPQKMQLNGHGVTLKLVIKQWRV